MELNLLFFLEMRYTSFFIDLSKQSYMQIGVIGINHKSADLHLREEISKICTRCFNPKIINTFPLVLLSTCNRTELYFSSEDLAETHSTLLNILRHEFAFPFEHKIYSYFGKDCFLHLAQVTAGLDSAMIGESEIQGQVKKAYEEASDYQSLNYSLHFLFQKCLKIGKEMRSQLPLYRTSLTLQDAIFQAGSHLLETLEGKKILLIGLSEINLKIFKYLKKKNLSVTICNRTFAKIQDLMEEETPCLLWEDLHLWPHYDLIIFGTKSPRYLMTPDDIQSPLIKRHVLIDLCVPRNVDPKMGRHPFLKLLNIDQLMKGIDRKRKIHAEEMARHETPCIETMVERQFHIFSARNLWKKQLYHFSSEPKASLLVSEVH